MSDKYLAAWKAETVTRALAAHGLAAELRPTISAPPFGRRRVVFAGRRTKKTAQVGFHQRMSDAIVQISECSLIAPELLAAVPALERLTGIGASRTNPVRLNVTLSDAGLDVCVSNAKELSSTTLAAVAKVAIEHDFARLAWNDQIVAAARPACRQFGRALVTPPPGAFVQATKLGEQALVACVREVTADAHYVADLFSGCGTFTFPMAEFAEVHAVENDAAMLSALDLAWRNTGGLKKVSHETRDLFSRPLRAAEINRFDGIVLDPPRAGALAQCEQIALSSVGRVAYVSCSPVSFARDVKLLVAAGFVIDWIQVVDQFRWSGHVELVASLVRK